MSTIFNLIDRVNKIDIEAAIPELVQQKAYEIITLNQQQLYTGRKSTNAKITPKYAGVYYAKGKAAVNPMPGFGTPDLFVTGAFYKGFGVVVNSKEYTVNSNEEKASKLELQYGSEIYGLTKENKADFAINTLLPAVREYIRTTAGI